MKLNLLILVFLFIFAIGSAQDYSISNVVFRPESPDTLMPNERVYFTFDYTKPGGDVRIYSHPRTSYSIGRAGWSSSPTYKDNNGSGENFFVYDNGAKVTSVGFYIKDVDGTKLYDTTFTVDYTYLGFDITELEVNPTSPASLEIGDSLNLSFNFKIPENMDLKIEIAAMSDDKVVSKQTTSQSPTYSDTTGTGTGFIKIDTLATVDQIRFQFIDANSNDTIIEVFEDVFYGFSNDPDMEYSISNVVYNPTSPGNVHAINHVDITFDYSKPYGDVHIFVQPFKSEGDGTAGTSGSGIYSDNEGSGDAFFTYNGNAVVNKVRFRIVSLSGIVLHEYFEEVHFSFSLGWESYLIDNIVFNPTSPDTIHTVDTLKFTFDYKKPFGDIKIFARPFKDGELKTGSTSAEIKTYSENSGSGNDYISFTDPASFDQIRFQMKSMLNKLLFETIVDVDYNFIQRPVSADYFKKSEEPEIYPNPSNGKLTIYVPSEEGFNYSIISLSGQTIMEGISNSSTLNLNTKQIKSGTYITKIIVDDKQFSKLVVFE
jgi:hypothetical protein